MAAVTMQDVADRAGVSKSTVSHVLNDTRFVEHSTKERVQLAMRELGYRPNLLARSLRRRETRTIGLLIPTIANPFWAELAAVIEQVGHEHGYAVLLGNSNWSDAQEWEYVQLLLSKQLDGLILASAVSTPAALDAIVTANVPLVMMNYTVQSGPFSSVLVDNHCGGYLAGQYLLRLGHRRAGCITPPSSSYDSNLRAAGFRQAFADAGSQLPDSAFVEGDFQYHGGEIGINTLLGRHPDLTAVFATNDHMAMGAIKGLYRMGRTVPGDVSVIGFDNISYTTATTPELTTIAQPLTKIGETIIHLLLKQINGPNDAYETLMLKPSLVERESCRALVAHTRTYQGVSEHSFQRRTIRD